MEKKVYHLSHTDLDGYACQFLTNKIFEKIEFYNSNYGNEIDEKLQEIFKKIEKDKEESFLVLITDLNLTKEQSKLLTELKNKSSKNVELLLLDHHITGEECAKEYEWYHLDTTKSATKITYEHFVKEHKELEEFADFVEIVNAIDIWLQESDKFEMGKVCMRLIKDSNEINRTLFPTEHSRYKFFLLEKAQEFFNKHKGNIKLEEAIHTIKKRFFLNYGQEDDTLDNLVSHFIVELLSKNKDKMSITYKGHKGILTYNIGNTSVIGNEFLTKNEDFDFFMDVTNRKTISLRANGKIDVSLMAKEIADGGGHKNASGGKLANFKDSFIYDNIKYQIQEILNSNQDKKEEG